MDKELLDYLLGIAWDHGIGYKLEPMEDDHWIPVYLPANNLIIINTNWHIPQQIPLQLAHEIGHALDGDNEYEYQACFAASSKVENAATRRGLELIIPHVYEDVEPYDVNYQRFMDSLAVPSHYAGVVEEIIDDYYTGREEQKWM